MEDEKKTVDTIKEKYKRIACRFIQGLLFDTENDFNKLEMTDIDFDAMKTIFDNYYKENGLCDKQDWHISLDGDNGLTIGKTTTTPASDTDNWQDSERMKVGAVRVENKEKTKKVMSIRDDYIGDPTFAPTIGL